MELWALRFNEMYSKPSIAQMQIIKYILKHDGKTIYQRDLEEVFNLRRATISGILKTMEKNNVIIRVWSWLTGWLHSSR